MPSGARVASLDQYRGFAVAAMLLVDFLGRFHAMPDAFRHPRVGFSFADAVAPMFVFIAGTGARLSFLRRSARDGPGRARRALARRCLLLVLVGAFVYGPDLRMDAWDALTDIGLAGLLALPVLGLGEGRRLGAAALCLALFQALGDGTGYGGWVRENSINGGPLGPLAWAFPLLFGTLAWDWLESGRAAEKGFAWGLALLALGHALSFERPYSQRLMSCSYAAASTGVACLAFALFHWLADRRKLELPTLGALGKSALAVYVLHLLLVRAWHGQGELFPKDASAAVALAGFAALYAACWSFARWLERRGWLVKL